MKANELRLGNYLQGKNTVVKVTRIFNEDEIGIGSGDPYTVSGENPCLLPIPLTEEWLLKCGFEWREGIEQESSLVIDLLGRIKIVYYSGNVNFTSLYQDNQCVDFVTGKIKYLHQLQNLFWILTGEELNIEL